MSIEALHFVPPVAASGPSATAATSGAASPAAPGFSDWLARGLEGVNAGLVASQRDVQSLALGESENLHHVMIRLEETKLAFQLAMQVRTRLLEAYQEIMRMQV